MSIATNITVPLIEDGLDRRLIAFSEPWVPLPGALPERYETVVAGLPAVVELGVPKNGIQTIYWALCPRAFDVPLQSSNPSNEWPGEVWGTAAIDRQLFFSVVPIRFHCRLHMRGPLRRLPHRDLDELRLSIGWAA